jgi:recombination associated protein RdgC
MFKNLTLFRLGPDWSSSLDMVEAALEKGRFVECGATQPQSAGWMAPRGSAGGPLVESIGGEWLMRLTVEQKIVPGAVVKRRTDEIADQIEQTTGRRPGRKQTKELKDQALLELLPMAFTKRAAVNVWLSPASRFLVIDTGSQTRADEVVTLLVQALEGLTVQALHTNESPATLMSDWLLTGEPAADFTVDRECELKSADEMKSAVRYARHPLDIDEVRQHIQQGADPPGDDLARPGVVRAGRHAATASPDLSRRRAGRRWRGAGRGALRCRCGHRHGRAAPPVAGADRGAGRRTPAGAVMKPLWNERSWNICCVALP